MASLNRSGEDFSTLDRFTGVLLALPSSSPSPPAQCFFPPSPGCCERTAPAVVISVLCSGEMIFIPTQNVVFVWALLKWIMMMMIIKPLAVDLLLLRSFKCKENLGGDMLF